MTKQKEARPAGRGGVTLAAVLDRAGRLATDGKLDEACALLEQTAARLGKTPDKAHLDTPQLLVQAAARLNRQHPALAAALAQEAVARAPEFVPAWHLLCGARDRLGDMAGAKEAALKVVQSEQALPEQVLGAANMLVRFNEDRIAIDAARKAFEALGRPLKWASGLLYIALKVADWPLAEQLTQQLLEAHRAGKTREAQESPRTNLQWCGDEEINLAMLRDWSSHALPLPKNVPPPRHADLAGRRLRVGYLSSDFREHPTSRLINGLFRHHDREKFELFLYCSGWDDGSEMRREVESHMDHVHSVAKLSDEAAAALIRSHGLDVLVELNGPTRANRMGILAHRPAPVQIDYLGWPGSVGGRVVDYVVGDAYTVPPGVEKHYPEKVIRLREIYQVNDYAARPPLPAPSRAEVGLPEGDVLVLGMFNAMNKVRGEVWAVWMRILKAVPRTVLWILDPGPLARENIARATREHGVSPRRIIAAPPMKQEAHLARLQCCDLMLDPWPYGGHTSTSDSLFAGVPVVALEGRNFAGRVSGGLLRAARLDVLVRPDTEAYVKTAVALLRNPERLASLKRFIRENIHKTDIFNARSKARQLESAYRAAVERSVKGLPPVHIALKGGRGADSAAALPPPAAPAQPAPEWPQDSGRRIPLVLVCGPWSSGTSAVAGMLAQAGLAAPGPYVEVNDPRTAATCEMRAFRDVLRELASEQTLQRLATPQAIAGALAGFRDGALAAALNEAAAAENRPVMLKHALTALMLPELCRVFDVRIVCVIRPLADIEATRARRRWRKSFGAEGAAVIYRHLFDHLVNSDTPFLAIRYRDVLAQPEAALDRMLEFCGIECDAQARAAALAFVARPPAASPAAAAAS